MNTPARGRWRPTRAGILNVYQYEDETLHFADGRLLLRGVNGSGKSTAMNMLLPFLLEADTRRIDAAGEQTGVLKSWMLAETDETQRTGYLWLEFERPAEEGPGTVHQTIGCGIRANRSTDKVATWWFSTPRRPRIDFSLTSARIPLSIDGLKVELGNDAVFTTVSEYRLEIARRFFGGVDPASYLALLHQIRNPRIGDRIDADLPRRLQEALPPVPEGAVADAAQPLEDLEDHRRNVTALERTDRALGSVLDTYRHYARRVLRSAADRAAESVTGARSAAQRRGRLRAAAEEADTRRDRLSREVDELDAEHTSAGSTLTGLLISPAYKQLEALVARRKAVAAQGDLAANLRKQSEAVLGRVTIAANEVGRRRDRVDSDLATVVADLDEARRHCRTAGIDVPLPPPPQLTVIMTGGLEGPDPEVDPLRQLDVVAVADAIRRRRQNVDQLGELVRRSTQAQRIAAEARTEADRIGARAEAARVLATAARTAAEAAAATHRSAIGEWTAQLMTTVLAVPAMEPDGSAGWLAEPDVAEPADSEPRLLALARVESARVAAEQVSAALEPAVADATLRVRRSEQLHTEVAEELTAVRSAAELPLPRAGWQQPSATDGDSFASLVEFAETVDAGTRAGLEAACEAAGLLSATVRADGVVLAENGELLLTPISKAAPNLTALLVPATGVAADPAVVERVLSAIGLGAASAAPLWVSGDGRFGAGALRGRHSKVTAEHIGVGARKAARRRRIAALEAELALAHSQLNTEKAVQQALVEWHSDLRLLVRSIPPTQPVDDAVADSVGATGDALRAADDAEQALTEAVAADLRAEQAWAIAETTAAQHGLPVAAEDLQEVLAEVDESAALVRRLPDRVSTARRSLHDWGDAVANWERESDAFEQASQEAEQAETHAHAARTELAAAEAALGDEPQRVAAQVEELTARLEGLADDLRARRSTHTAAATAAATARAGLLGADEQTQRAENACAAERERLRAVLLVDGLLTAADGRPPYVAPEVRVSNGADVGGQVGGPDGDHRAVSGNLDEDSGPNGDQVTGGPGRDRAGDRLPEVPDTVDGTARLVAAIREAVPEPTRDVAEDTLDRSLRQIRDSLGAGWDAGSRRADDGAPVSVEVSGPYGRRALPAAAIQVTADLRRARGLLTAQQDQALRNLLHGRVAREVAQALFAANELVRSMNSILGAVTTSQGIGVRLEWRTRDDLDPATATALRLLGKDPDARSESEDMAVRGAVTGLVEEARSADPEPSYRDVIARVLDYRTLARTEDLRAPTRPRRRAAPTPDPAVGR